MSTKVYKSPVTKPDIRIEGKLINTITGKIGSRTNVSIDQTPKLKGKAVRATKGESTGIFPLFADEVNITFYVDSYVKKSLQNSNYNNANAKIASTTFQGKETSGKFSQATLVQNNIAYIYYTLNGKDPSRTKSNLYTGPIKLRHNQASGDNVVIKARVYFNGQFSDVSVANIGIARRRGSKTF